MSNASPAHAVRMAGIRKSFGGVQALRGVDFTVKSGTVHALMGENGAGKSTLLKILRGVQAPDEGQVSIFGTAMTQFTAQAARDLGVGMIFQELSVVPSLTVAENIFLGREPRKMGLFIDQREADAKARNLLQDLGVDIDPRTPLRRLSSGQMQMTEIAKAISQDARVLILDEPTSALCTAEVERLFAFLKRVSAQGMAVVYVSHRMDEITEVAQEVTILRDGANVVSSTMAETTLDGIVENMVGRRLHSFTWSPRQVDRSQRPLLAVEDLHGVGGKPDAVSFKLFPGEVLGIAGLLGSGRSELARVLFGVDPMRSGRIFKDGQLLDICSPSDAIEQGIALIPESRSREGLVLTHGVSANLSLPMLDDVTRGLLIDRQRETDLARVWVERLRVKTDSLQAAVRTLSGGNQQKVVLGKWLATNPDVVILDEPTAGVDIGSKSEIVDLIRSLADAGKGIVLISSELPELLAVSDRVLIMSDGRIAREILREEIASWSSDAGESQSESHQIAGAEQRLQYAIQQVRFQ
jgi:ribose transport system ATP-binding protein